MFIANGKNHILASVPASLRLLAASALVGAALCATPASAQDTSHHGVPTHNLSTELGITFTAERAEIAPDTCHCFWLKGGSVDASMTFFHGLGVAAAVNGEHASHISTDVDLSLLTFLAGPHYSYTLIRSSAAHRQLKPEFFAQGLFGSVHGFDSVFPGRLATTSSATAFAMQLGGGINLLHHGGFGFRALQIDCVRSELLNSYANHQNDLRLGAGLVYHFHQH